MNNGTIIEQIRMQERVNELTHSLQHDDMNSIVHSVKQKKQEDDKRQNRRLKF